MADHAKLIHLFVEEKRSEPFAWGVNDCCLFTSDWIAMRSGIDPAAELGLRGAYQSAIGAARILAKHGGVEAIMIDVGVRHNWPEVPGVRARRGDVALLELEEGPALGVVVLGMVAFAGKSGIEFYPVRTCRRFWRID